ncbi:hypothetical protein P4S73_25625 [Paraglaciecola sp. Hal342]
MIDPGFGFGKSLAHNYQLLAQLEALHLLGYLITCWDVEKVNDRPVAKPNHG